MRRADGSFAPTIAVQPLLAPTLKRSFRRAAGLTDASGNLTRNACHFEPLIRGPVVLGHVVAV